MPGDLGETYKFFFLVTINADIVTSSKKFPCWDNRVGCHFFSWLMAHAKTQRFHSWAHNNHDWLALDFSYTHAFNDNHNTMSLCTNLTLLLLPMII